MPERVINHYEHKDKERVNNPPGGLVTRQTDIVSNVAISEGTRLNGPFWPEEIEVVKCERKAGHLFLTAKGVKTGSFYEATLSPHEEERITVLAGRAVDFSSDGEGFFLAAEAHRVRYAYQFDPLFAVSVSQVDPLPHQIEAVYHHVLKNPRLRFLLADDPGAGKTVMAGLILKELKYRGLVERTLIVVPGHLRDQWLREMKEKFQEHFVPVDRAVAGAFWGRNVWQEHAQVIASMDYAKQDDVLAALNEVRWDLVIVDEAHKMAAYRYGEKVKKTERYRLGETLSRNASYLLFLTATPHRGDPENFRLLLDLLEPGMFADVASLAEAAANRENPLFLRRLKEDLKKIDGTPLFPPRQVHTVKFSLSGPERELYNAVTDYVRRHYQKALAKDKRNVTFALLVLQRRLASSVRAARESLERRLRRLDELLRKGVLLREQGYIDEEALEDRPEAERERLEDELMEKLTSAETLEELRQEVARLGELVSLARRAERQETETKLNELKKVLAQEHLRAGREKLLIFTESRATLEYLREKLREWGYGVVWIHGGMSLDERIAAERRFWQDAQVMVATEAAGEGINLQCCWLMINYDIPWNPNRLEQRMGRVHRYGQQKEVHIYNLVAQDTLEGKVLLRLFEKLENIRRAMGSDRVFDVVGDVLAGRSLRDLIVEAVTNQRSLEDILKDIELEPDEEAVRRVREATQEMLATRHVDLAAVLGEMERARANRLVPEYVEQFFRRAARRLGVAVEIRPDGTLRARVPFEVRRVTREFRNRYGEVLPEYARLSFRKETARDGQAEFIAMGHPLFEAVVERILEGCGPFLRRGAVFEDPDGRLRGLLWLLEAEVRDGRGRTAGKRLFAVYQSADGSVREVSPAVFWDLKPAGREVPSEIRVMAESDEAAVATVLSGPLPAYREELLAARRRDATIKEKYGLRSLEALILESEAKLADYELRRAMGESVPDPVLVNERRRREELEERRRRLREEIAAETALSMAPPRVLGVAAVLPAEEPPEVLREDPQVERIGMEMAMRYERTQGRAPEDVSHANVGYDIISRAPDGSNRYIEVKARARTGKVALTTNEWLTAQKLGGDYWLYVVANAATKPELYVVRDPASNLKPEEEVEIVRYVVGDWQTVALKEEV